MIEDDFKEISFDGFEKYRLQHKEADFQVVDVRQEKEYAKGHVPGAKLIPLGTLGDHLSEIPGDKDLFFYCHSGARSEVAGIMATEEGRPWQKTYNITGGFRSYQGHTAEGLPRVQVFDHNQSQDRLLYKAMELEKAAQQFYETILSSGLQDKFTATIEQLAKAETAHAKTIYTYWKKTVEHPAPFEEIYSGLKGDILEDGRPFSDVTARIQSNGKEKWTDLMEMALTIEIQAYDLYRSMADRQNEGTAKEAFLFIAQMEKAHMKMVATMLGDD